MGAGNITIAYHDVSSEQLETLLNNAGNVDFKHYTSKQHNDLLLAVLNHEKEGLSSRDIRPLYGFVSAMRTGYITREAKQIEHTATTYIGINPSNLSYIPIAPVALSIPGSYGSTRPNTYLLPTSKDLESVLELENGDLIFQCDFKASNVKHINSVLRGYFDMLAEVLRLFYEYSHVVNPQFEILVRPVFIKNANFGEYNVICNMISKEIEPERVEKRREQSEKSANEVKTAPENVTFDMIGGQNEAVDELRFICESVKKQDIVDKWGGRIPKGVLLYGPPGNGKTTLAKAAAYEIDAEFTEIRLQDVTSMWRGNEQIAVRDLIRNTAKRAKDRKAIIFIDELDTLGASRDDPNIHEATKETVTTLCTEMDGFRSYKNVLFIAATNKHYPEKGFSLLDDALLRPGRFDRHVYVGNPDLSGRAEILKIHLDKLKEKAKDDIFGQHGIDCVAIASATADYSGADIEEVIRRAVNEKIKQEFKRQVPGPLETADVLSEIKRYERKKETKKKIAF